MLIPVEKSSKILMKKLELLDLEDLKNAIIDYNHSEEKRIGAAEHKDDVCEMTLSAIDLLDENLFRLKLSIKYLQQIK